MFKYTFMAAALALFTAPIDWSNLTDIDLLATINTSTIEVVRS